MRSSVVQALQLPFPLSVSIITWAVESLVSVSVFQRLSHRTFFLWGRQWPHCPQNPSWCLLSALSLLAMLSGLPPSDVFCSWLHNLQGIPKTRPRGVQHFHWGFGKELWRNPKPRASLMLVSVHKDASCAAWAPNGLPHTVSTSSLTKGKLSLQEEQGEWGSGRGWKKREMVKNNN